MCGPVSWCAAPRQSGKKVESGERLKKDMTVTEEHLTLSDRRHHRHSRKSEVGLMAAWGVRNPYLYTPIQVIQIKEQKDGSQMYYVHW